MFVELLYKGEIMVINVGCTHRHSQSHTVEGEIPDQAWWSRRKEITIWRSCHYPASRTFAGLKFLFNGDLPHLPALPVGWSPR